MLWKAAELPQFDQYAGIGPGMFPTIVGAVLVLLGLLLALQIHRGVRFEEQEAEDVAEAVVGLIRLDSRVLPVSLELWQTNP